MSGRVRQDQVGLITVHQAGVDLLTGTVAADDPMLSDQPQVSHLTEDRLLQFGIHIKIILVDLLVMELIEQRIDLGRIKSRLTQIEVAVLDILQQLRQQGIVPSTGNLIECNVQRLLPDLIDVYHSAGHFGVAEVHSYRQSLMAADDGHIGIHNQGISEAKLLNTVFDLFVLFIPSLQLLAGIVLCRFEHGYRQDFQFSSFLHRSLHLRCQL